MTWRAFGCAMLLLTTGRGSAAQSVVRLEAAGQIGQGIAIPRGNDCRVVAPKHVVGDMLGETVLQSAEGGRIALDLLDNAAVVLTLPDGQEAREDLVMLRPRENARAVCDNNLSRFTDRSAVVVTTDGQGNFRFHDVVVRDQSERALMFVFGTQQSGQIQSMSGAPIVRAGSLVGMVVRLSTSSGDGQHVAYSVDLMARQFGDWIRGESVPVASAEAALSVLDRVRGQLPAADVGQVSALTSLSSGGARLAGFDLQGFYLGSAAFSEIDLSTANLSAADLSRTRFTNAVLTGATLDFVVGQGVELVNAKLERSHHQYADYDRANFNGASFRQANLYFATLRGAGLRNVDFTGANLSYADLTGADLTGARFENAVLYGATLTDARGLDSALFRATAVTNMVGASGRAFTDDEVCGHFVDRGGFDHMSVIERIPSPRFDGGFENRRLQREADWLGMPAEMLGMGHTFSLRACPQLPETDWPAGVEIRYSQGQRAHLSIGVSRAYHTDLLSKRDLRRSISNRMVQRNKEVLESLASRNFVLPVSDRSRQATAHVRRLTAAIRRGTVDCIDTESVPHLLRAAQSRRAAGIYDELVAQVAEIAHKRESAKRFTEGTGHVVDESFLFPFGDIHPDVQYHEHGSTTAINFDREFIAAYEAWSRARMENATFAFCAASAGLTEGVGLPQADPVVGTWPVDSSAAAFLRRMNPGTPLFTWAQTSRWSSETIAWYIEGAPEAFRTDSAFRSLSRSLPVGEQRQVHLRIDRIEDVPAHGLLVVFARVIREQSIRVTRDR